MTAINGIEDDVEGGKKSVVSVAREVAREESVLTSDDKMATKLVDAGPKARELAGTTLLSA